jgi:cytidylate kinase
MPRDVQSMVEESIKQWQATRRIRAQAPRAELSRRPNVITLSTALGAGGTSFAHAVADRLRLPVYDREIVRHIATSAHVHERTVEALDERALRRVDDHLAALFRERGFDQSDYLRLLTRTVGALWEHGPCVIVGHGAVHIVAPEHTLAVRVVAHLEERLRHVMETRKLSRADARALLEETDAERASFHRRYFRADVDDPTGYDLVINTSRLPPSIAVATVVDAYRAKLPA